MTKILLQSEISPSIHPFNSNFRSRPNYFMRCGLSCRTFTQKCFFYECLFSLVEFNIDYPQCYDVKFKNCNLNKTACPLSYFSFQPVLHDWCNKGRGMCYPVCGMVHIKEPLLLIDRSSLCGGSGFPFSLSEWSFTICLTPYNRR